MSTITKPTTIDEYLAALPSDVRDALEKLRQTIKLIVREAENGGLRLFEHTGTEMIRLKKIGVIEYLTRTNLRFRVVKPRI